MMTTMIIIIRVGVHFAEIRSPAEHYRLICRPLYRTFRRTDDDGLAFCCDSSCEAVRGWQWVGDANSETSGGNIIDGWSCTNGADLVSAMTAWMLDWDAAAAARCFGGVGVNRARRPASFDNNETRGWWLALNARHPDVVVVAARQMLVPSTTLAPGRHGELNLRSKYWTQKYQDNH